MDKRIPFGLVLAGMVFSGLAACGGSDSGGGNPANDDDDDVITPDDPRFPYRYEPEERLDFNNVSGEYDFPGGLEPGDPPKSGFRLVLPSVHSEPFQEQTGCYVWDMPQGLANEYIYTMELKSTSGMHHGNLITKEINPLQPLEMGWQTDYPPGASPCDPFNGLDPAALPQVLYAMSTQTFGVEHYAFPDGYALKWLPGRQAMISVHYLNTTDEETWTDAVYDLYTMPVEHLDHEVVAFAMFSDYFTIPAASDHTLVTECEFKNGSNIVSYMPHMHYRGTSYLLELLDEPGGAGEELYYDGLFDQESDIVNFDPYVNLDGHWGLRFTCSWRNELDRSLTYGIGENEMCQALGYTWPPETQTVGLSQAVSTGPDGKEYGECQSIYLGEMASNFKK